MCLLALTGNQTDISLQRIRLYYYPITTLSSHLTPDKRDIDLKKQATPGSDEKHTLLDLLVPNSAEPSAIPLPDDMPLLNANDPYSGFHQYGFFDFCDADGNIYLCDKRSYTILVMQTKTLDRDTIVRPALLVTSLEGCVLTLFTLSSTPARPSALPTTSTPARSARSLRSARTKPPSSGLPVP